MPRLCLNINESNISVFSGELSNLTKVEIISKVYMQTEIEKLLGEFVVYLYPEYFLHPEYLLPDCPAPLKPESPAYKKMEVYFALITNINWILKKVERYRVYFLEFYPNSSSIKDHEALQHHLHAYLEDLATVKNKLTVYLGALKNDLKQVVINKKEIGDAIDWLIRQVHETFKNSLAVRDEHRHKGQRFTGKYIADAEIMDMVLDDSFPLKGQLTEEGIVKALKRQKQSFEEGKVHWSKNATNNYKQVHGLVNQVAEKTKGFLYQLLGIKPIDSIRGGNLKK